MGSPLHIYSSCVGGPAIRLYYWNWITNFFPRPHSYPRDSILYLNRIEDFNYVRQPCCYHHCFTTRTLPSKQRCSLTRHSNLSLNSKILPCFILLPAFLLCPNLLLISARCGEGDSGYPSQAGTTRERWGSVCVLVFACLPSRAPRNAVGSTTWR